MSLILCGLPKCGKTTTAMFLAKRLGGNFVDIDLLIEHAYTLQTGRKCSIRDIYLKEGENRFRHLEKLQIACLNDLRPEVISIGGGALIDLDNAQALQKIGRLIYLKIPLDILWKRFEGHDMPAYLDAEHPRKAFYALAKKRIPIYERFAHEIIEANHLNPEQIVEILLQLSKRAPWMRETDDTLYR